MLKFEDVATYWPGDVPIILCSHHDGQKTALNGAKLEELRKRHNDEGTRDLALRTAEIIQREHGKSPHLVIFDINIQVSTDEMFSLYIQKVKDVINACLEDRDWRKCVVIDIHRFYKHPDLIGGITREYDIWFGTDHCQSVRDNFDVKFASAMVKAYIKLYNRNIAIYVPDIKEKIGESFGATGKTPERTILTKVISDTFENKSVSAIQAEFYIDHLQEGAPRTNLATAFASALAKSI